MNSYSLARLVWTTLGLSITRFSGLQLSRLMLLLAPLPHSLVPPTRPTVFPYSPTPRTNRDIFVFFLLKTYVTQQRAD